MELPPEEAAPLQGVPSGHLQPSTQQRLPALQVPSAQQPTLEHLQELAAGFLSQQLVPHLQLPAHLQLSPQVHFPSAMHLQSAAAWSDI